MLNTKRQMIRLCGWGVEIGSANRGRKREREGKRGGGEERGKGRIKNRRWNEEEGEGGIVKGGIREE